MWIGLGDQNAICVTLLNMPSSKKEQVIQESLRVCMFLFHWLRHIYSINFCNATGYGGGFNERENVEYIEREESDGEYDEVSSCWHPAVKKLIFKK